MELINNRYKVEMLLNKDIFEDYLVEDSLDNNKKVMRIIDGNMYGELVEFYTNEFLWLKNIKHKRILSAEAFGIIETINLKPNESPLYYVTSEKKPKESLDQVYKNLNIFEIIKIVQELMSVMDYLHFRGFTYKYLDPKKIFYTKDKGIKLLNLNVVIEHSFSKKIDPFNEDFLTPNVLLRKDINNLTDLFSIGMIMRYLLLNESEDHNLFSFREELKIDEQGQKLLKDIITKLINAYRDKNHISLVSIIEKLNKISGQEFIHNFKEDREHLYLKTKLIGREDELEYIKEIDRKIINNSLDFNGLMIKAMSGAGKTRLLKEISFRLRLKSRTVYTVNVDQSLSYELDIIKIFLNIITNDVEDRVLSRYRSSFKDFIPNKYDSIEDTINEKSIQRIELYKLFNSICNYLKEISLSKPVYIIIDNINKYNETFIHLIDYLLQSLLDSKVFIIFTYDGRYNERSLYYNLEKWIKERFIEEIALNNLTRKDISILTQNILGISFVPSKLASVFFAVSKGNPRFLDLTIKEIFSKKELYISDKGKWYSDKDNYTDLSLPTDFRKTIIEQTKDISGDKLNVLKVISISNESISKFLIYNMLNFEMVDLNNTINSLLNEQVLVERNYNNNFHYGFLSNELKATIYYDMDDHERKLLHRQLADLLLFYNPDMIRDLTEETTYHLIRANDRGDAIDLVVQEAEKIGNIYNERAISLWEMAFSIMKNTNNEKKLYILDKLTKINLHRYNEGELNSYLAVFKEEAYKLNDVKSIIKSYNYEAEIYLRNNDFQKLNNTIEEIERLSVEHDSTEGLILSCIVKIRLLNKDTEIDRLYIKDLLDRALELSNNIKDYLGQIYLLYGLFKYINGESNEAIIYYEQSIKYLEENGEIYDAIKAINNLGNVYLQEFGNRERCFEYFHQGLEIINKYEFTQLEPILLFNIGDIYLNMLELVKAKGYMNRTLQVANTNKDMDMIFMSNCNLGRIYVLSNEYDKAYETCVLLRGMVKNVQITDTEILIAYRNFLGLFYYAFGQFDKGYKYSKLASEMSHNLSENDYFTSTFRMYHIDYLRGSLDKKNFYNFLQEFNKENLYEMYNWNLLSLAISSLLKDDIEFAKDLRTYYLKGKSKDNLEMFTYIADIINLYIIGNNDNLLIIEDIINKKEKFDVIKISFKYYLLLARMFSKFDKQKMALRYYIKAFDYISYSIYSIEDIDLKRLFILKFDIDEIKRKINDISNYLYNVKVFTLKIDDFTDSNLNSYFDLTPVIKSLNNDEISDIVGYGDTGIGSIDELVSNFVIDYKENIQLVLGYLAKVTLANKGFILTIKNGVIDLNQPLVSLVEGDNNLPNEMILYQSLKRENGFLFNRNFTKNNLNKHLSSHLPENARGVICVPIKKYEDKDFEGLSRSYQESKGNLYGYIYLETDNILNRFDEESVELSFSLSKLIALNLENEKLRLNSTTDKITSVYMREYFEAKFDGILEAYKVRQGELSVLMIDIDRFKRFNDRYGHVRGDEILAKVGKSIKNTVDSNGIVGRYGGEEFVVLLWDCTIDKAIMFAEDIRKNIEKTYIPDVEDTVTVSIGLAQFPNHGNYIVDLINSADQALYYAKEVLCRNSIAVWHKDLQNTNQNIDKTKGVVSGNIAKDNRNILQLMDIAESIKEDKDMVDKIYQLLSSIITISDCEYATFIDYRDGKINNYYTRKREEIEWIDKRLIHINLINEVYNSKTGLCTIDWHDKSKEYLHVPDWDSHLIVPIIKKDVVHGILYLTVPLKEGEFNQETMNVINMFANIFSGNY